MSDKKRSYDGNGDVSTSKKLKSSDTSSNGASSSGPADDLIAKKRAEIAAKLAAMKKSSLSSTAAAAAAAGVPPKPSFAAPIPVKPMTSLPHVSATPSPASSRTPSTPAGASPNPTLAGQNPDDLARRVAEAKKRVAEAQSKLANKDNPYLAMVSQPLKKSKQPPPSEPTQQGAGLKMAAHPLLLDTTPAAPQSKKDRYKPMQPKFASIKANARNAPPSPLTPAPAATPDITNPYAASSVKDTGFEGAPKERTGRNFRFNPKGKYVALGNQMRQDVQLEALKQRIAESARKAGLDGDMGVEKGLKRPPPPVAEWWDAALLPSQNYEDLTMGMENLNVYAHESPITIYIQHPIPIPAPDANKAELKPLMLTTKERKKMRKRRRADALKDKNDRIRMGLLPPDPPKVRIANLMKVLTSDAIQDPTRVEARVRREVAMRKHNHEKMNAERKLTDEQRREKIETKKVEEEKRGIYACVYKIKNLSDPSHQFKVRVNAEQHNLSGVCIFHSQFNLVYVEGAAKFIRQFKRLMLHRIAWTEAARARGGTDDVEIENPDSDAEENGKGEGTSAAVNVATKGAAPGEEDGNAVASLENNKCYLIWEGQVRDRAFANFRGRACPTERDAKEVLGEKLRGYWDQAKNWKPEEEELF